MTKLREAAEMALEVLKKSAYSTYSDTLLVLCNEAIEALRQALAQADRPEPTQPEQEPVCDKDPRGCWSLRCQLGKACKNTTPPSKPWVGLTGDEIVDAYCEVCGKEWCLGGISNAETFYDVIEAKLKERNT